jgi:hypothetical protein
LDCVSDKSSEAHQVITTAVQQGPQMVEIQGAPAAIPATGDEFRATFAASVGGAAAQRPGQPTANGGAAGSGAAAQSGVASARHILLAGLVAKASSPSASGALQGAPDPEGAGGDASAVEGSKEAALANLNAASEGSLKGAAADPLSADVSSAADSGLASAALSAAAIALKTQGFASANPQAATASALAASAGAAKDVAAAQSTDSAAARGRRELAVSGKDASASAAAASAAGSAGASLQIAALAVPVVQLDTTTVAQALQTRTPDGASIAQPGAKTAVLTSVLEAGDGASGFHGSPVSGGEVPDGAVTLHPELNAAASAERNAFSATIATAAAQGSGETANSGTIASATAGAQGAAVVADAQTAGREGSSATAGSIAAVSEANLKPVAGAAQTKSVSAGGSVGVRASSTTKTTEAAATQVSSTAHPHPVSNVQPRIGSQTAGSKATGSVATQIPGSGGEDSAGRALPTGAVTAAASGPAITTQGEIKLAQQPDAVRDGAAVAVPLTEASARAGIQAAKDEKTKGVAATSDDTTSTQSAGAQSVTGEISNAAGNLAANLTASFAAATAGAAGRAVPGTDAAVPVTLAAAHVGQVTSHDAASPAGLAASGRALGGVSAGSIAEAGPAGAPIGEAHRTLLATPTTLEVGVPGGTQGWLRIRAEVGGPGEVNASLTAASSGAREALHSQLPALNAFLHSEQIAATATVAERGAGFAGGGQGGAALGSGGLGSGGLGSGGLGGDGSNASLLQGGGAQSGGGQREAAQPVASVSEAVRSYDSLGGVSEAAGPLLGSTSISEESGRWLNVRA